MIKRGVFLFSALSAFAGSALGQMDSVQPMPTNLQTNRWVSVEAMQFSVKSAPLLPTLTTFPPGTPSASAGSGGALGVPGTIVLSPDQLDYGHFGGGRLTLGGWLNSNQRFGLEATGFILGNRSAGFSTTSSGSPPLRVPFINVPPGDGFPLGASSFVLADQGFARGSQFINSSLHFWGAEGDGLYHVVNKEALNMSLMVGFRYLDLNESLSIVSNETLTPIGFDDAFTASDSFSTRNQFYGVDLGVKAQSTAGRFDALLLAKVALGDNHQTVSVNGRNSVIGFGESPAFSPVGGIFAQSTNIRQKSSDEFAVVPEMKLQLGYMVTRRIHAFVSYDFLYLSDVVRPGNQIDRTLNLTSNAAITGVSAPTLMGAPRPEPLSNDSSFWAQSINAGIEFLF